MAPVYPGDLCPLHTITMYMIPHKNKIKQTSKYESGEENLIVYKLFFLNQTLFYSNHSHLEQKHSIKRTLSNLISVTHAAHECLFQVPHR
jgi:hypothetical protein